MTLDDALGDFATSHNEMPVAAMQWALDHWDEAGPRFTALLDAYARGEDRLERHEQALFIVIHLLGEKAEAAAFAPLCRLLLDAETASLVLGDAIALTLPRVLVSTYNGDLSPLTSVIESPDADEFVRNSALLAMAYLTRTGRVPEPDMRGALARWFEALSPQGENYVWVGWTTAVSALGYQEFADQAETLIRREFVAPDVMGLEHFRDDLQRTLDDPERMIGFEPDRIGPFGKASDELAEFTWTNDEEARDEEEWEIPQPFSNPLRNVGRNDPCPCGSGKKFKKCCLQQEEAALALLRS